MNTVNCMQQQQQQQHSKIIHNVLKLFCARISWSWSSHTLLIEFFFSVHCSSLFLFFRCTELNENVKMFISKIDKYGSSTSKSHACCYFSYFLMCPRCVVYSTPKYHSCVCIVSGKEYVCLVIKLTEQKSERANTWKKEEKNKRMCHCLQYVNWL